MRRAVIILLIGMITMGIGVVQADNTVTVQSMPPVVVQTFPQAGDTDVDPSITEIRVTFSKEMMTQEMWSWVMISRETFPPITGDIKFLEDKRTCVAPVKLEAGKTYVVWFNSKTYNYFKDTHQNSAIPYLLVFQTKK
jgi:hypothetical protein